MQPIVKTDMAPNNQQQQAAAAAAAVRLPDFHADSPQCWFDCLDSTFATANITQSITKFHWAMSKLPFSLTPTIRPLTPTPARRRGPRRPAGYTSPQSYQPNRAGNRFPLARRQGFLHAPPPFSTTPPLGPPATAECRQD